MHLKNKKKMLMSIPSRLGIVGLISIGLDKEREKELRQAHEFMMENGLELDWIQY